MVLECREGKDFTEKNEKPKYASVECQESGFVLSYPLALALRADWIAEIDFDPG